MRYRLMIVISVMLCSNLSAQNLFSHKDLGFAQVAIGPTIKSVVTLTNRGTFTYAGWILFSTGEGSIWNPLVNNVAISDGQFRVEIEPDHTLVVELTGNVLESGSAILIADDLILDNFVEGNLTYLINDAGVIVDSVGVPPSAEVYLAAIPFENFSSVGLALASGDLGGANETEVLLSLLKEDGALLDSRIVVLQPLEHQAQFLDELFPGIYLEKGKVEIASEFPIFGTALTLVGNQISTLPMESSPVGYIMRMIASDGTVFDADLTLWAEGFFVKGYMVVSKVGDAEVQDQVLTLVSGELIDGFLRLSFFAQGEAFFGEQVTLFLEHPDFFFGSELLSGTWVMMFLSDNATLTGTYELTRTTP